MLVFHDRNIKKNCIKKGHREDALLRKITIIAYATICKFTADVLPFSEASS